MVVVDSFSFMYDLKIGVRYNLQFRGTPILGTGLKNARCCGVVDYRVASNESNVTTLHSNMIPYLEANVQHDPTVLSYVIFETESGARGAYAYPWIVESSIEVAQNKTLTFTVPGGSADDAQRIKDILSSAGWKNITFVLV